MYLILHSKHWIDFTSTYSVLQDNSPCSFVIKCYQTNQSTQEYSCVENFGNLNKYQKC